MTRRLLVAGAVVALFAVAPVGRANRTMAAVFTVNSTVDAVDVSPGDGACATLGGRCTLRAAVQEANARPGADGVSLPAGTYVLAILGAGEDAAVTGDLDITDDLTITGAGAESTIVDGGHIDRVFHVVRRLEGPTVEISGIAVRNGLVSVDQSGGGILNSSTLALNTSAIVNNSAGSGGAVANDTGAFLAVTDSTVSGNTAGNVGGLYNLWGSMTITRTTISGNSAQLEAGGLGGPGTSIVIGSVVSDNQAGGKGGGIGVPPTPDSSLTVEGSTISGNTAGVDGGGIAVGAPFTMSDSLVSDNVSQAFGGGVFMGNLLWSPFDPSFGGFRTITGSIFINNSAALDGGGIFDDGNVTISGCVVSGNIANAGLPFGAQVPGFGLGGGISLRGSGTVTDSTISENSALRGGGISMADGTFEVTNSTISGNSATTDGGGITAEAGAISLNNLTIAHNSADSDGDGTGDGGGLAGADAFVSIGNTIVAHNVDTGGQAPDCTGRIDSRGYNLIENGTHCVWVGGPADITGRDPRLGSLANNGATTPTHALLPGSPAIDSGHPAAPGSGGDACEANDQRGISRPQDGNADGVARCDIGAFERRGSPAR